MRVALTDPTAVKLDKCRTCGAAIVWAETEKGRRMPVDAERTAAGNLVLWARQLSFSDAGGELGPTKVSAADLVHRAELGGLLWTSHFATCPHAAQHRKAPHGQAG